MIQVMIPMSCLKVWIKKEHNIDYKFSEQKFVFEHNDIGIIKVDRPFQQTNFARPISPSKIETYYPEGNFVKGISCNSSILGN